MDQLRLQRMESPLRTCTAWRGQGECLACDGRENAFFAGLSPDAIGHMHVNVDNTATDAAAVLYRPTTPAKDIWVLRTGAVKLLGVSWDGVERIVRVLKPGDVAGLEALLAGSYAHEAIALGEVRACRVPLAEIEQLCLEYPTFQWNLMKKLQAALRETEQWLIDMATTGASARVRMARLLLRLRDGESNRIYNFTRDDLGRMLGIALETASRIIAAFQRERLLVRRPGDHRFYDGDIVRLEMIARGT